MLCVAKCFTGPVGTEGEDISYVLGVTVEKGQVQATDFSVLDIYGHGQLQGCGRPHSFAVQQLLEYLKDRGI